ncbi:hypothetical protein ACSBR1_018915 [Camellia fascicularis]
MGSTELWGLATARGYSNFHEHYTCCTWRTAFDGCCPDCKFPGDDCPLIWGACNHAFHLHCILKWVNSQTPQAQCPMCRGEWQFKG